MYKAFFAGMDPTLPLLAMGIFVGAFLLMLARTWGYKTKADFDAVAALPLADEQVQVNSHSDKHKDEVQA